MNVLFIQFSGMQESLGVASLAGSLEKAGHKTGLILVSHAQDLKTEIERFNPGLIGFSVNTGAHREVEQLARFLRQQTDVPTIIGGPHATFFADNVADTHGFSYICRGEGETAMVQLADHLENHANPENIAGLWVSTHSGWKRNEIGRLVEDLDSLPMPKRDIYYHYRFLRNINMKRFVTGLGCPFACAFCFNSNCLRLYKGKGKYVRRKSVDRVLEEILSVKRISPLTRVHFSDDLFTLDKKWLIEFAEKYPGKVGIPFSCGTRLDCESDIVAVLAEAGCCAIQLGFESGSQRVRRELLKKNWTNEQAIELTAQFKRHGIAAMSLNMIALPGETMAEIQETLEWNSRIGFKYVRVGFFVPYPELDLTEKAKSLRLLEPDFSLKNYYPNPLFPEFMKERTDELMNLVSVFFFAVKLRLLRRFILNHLVKIKCRKLFAYIGWVNLVQELFFFRLHIIPAFIYFRNTLGSVWGFRWGAWPATRVLGKKEKAF